MKVLSKPGQRRIFSIVISVSLLTLICVTYVRAPSIFWNIDFYLRFGCLDLAKKVVLEKKVDECTVRLYSTKSDGKIIRIANTQALDQIIKETFEDFPEFIQKHYHRTIPKDKKVKNLSIVVVAKGNFYSYDKLQGGPVGAATLTTQGTKFWGKLLPFKRIYFSDDNGEFDILTNKETIRHEIFHWMEYEYGLENIIVHNDVYDFAKMRQKATI